MPARRFLQVLASIFSQCYAPEAQWSRRPVTEICFEFFLFIGLLLQDGAASNLICGTPGVLFVVGRRTSLVDNRNSSILEVAFPDLATFIAGPLAGRDPTSVRGFVCCIDE
ncbi:hypothetical protein B0H17DRAFT_1199267 [Mycena rosella]|uniref:Uncharacterized protein n=1 Tax=Mycena rosella TaxID=1033263 RepID=A0AAD7DPF4_MYCRO|nr:hypothetical protein B0H17DRAFT_1199267 [Mycena rosella]